MSQLVDALNADFRRIVEEYHTPEHPNGQLHRELSQEMTDKGCTFAAGPMPIYIKPYFIDAKWRDEIIRTTEASIRVMDKVSDLYYDQPETRPMFYLSEAETELSEIPHGYPGRVMITRNDAFMTDDDLQYVEFNADSPGGPMYSDMQATITEGFPVFKTLAETYDIHRDKIMPRVLQTLLHCYRAWGGTKEHPAIVITAGKAGGTLPEFLAIVEWFKRQGITSTFCDTREWSYDGKTLAAPDGTVPDIIWRRGWIGDWSHVMPDIKNILAGLRDRKACLVNPLNSVLGSNKSLLAVIQRDDIMKMFDTIEAEFVRNNVPWTRVVEEGKTTDWNGKTIDLPEFIGKNREQLIFKPIDQYGGKDVVIGPAVNDGEWDTWVSKALAGKFIVQKFVHIPEEDLPTLDEEKNEIIWTKKKINVNFYAYGGKYTGGVVRSSDSPVINVHKGGGMTPIMYVFGKK
ncbi:MAG: hypothetical protein ACYS47_21265 [Planctomycetota bacterium]|jgi:hypothetical protein